MRKLADVILEQRPLIMNETANVMAACERMRDSQAGSVLVTGDDGRLVGIFTGRDAVCRVVAAGRDATTTRLADVMTAKPATMSPDQTAIDAMRPDVGRRLPTRAAGEEWQDTWCRLPRRLQRCGAQPSRG